MLSPWPTLIDLFQIEKNLMSENTFTSWESSLRVQGPGPIQSTDAYGQNQDHGRSFHRYDMIRNGTWYGFLVRDFIW